MNISVFGLGYVGSVTAVCLAADGHQVWGVDKDKTKVNWLREGRAPIREPGLETGLASVLKNRKLTISLGAEEAVQATDIALVCVGTPTSSEHGTDITFVLKVIEEIGQALKNSARPYTILLRSTVPPGTTRDLVLPRLEEVSGRVLGRGLELYFNPEFLRQGSALKDFYQAPFTVIGIHPDSTCLDSEVVRQVYEKVDAQLLVVNYQEAELLKLACNAFHALKIDFANEIGTLAQHLDANPASIMTAFVRDTKLNISKAYLRSGFAFGGSCLPKDVRSLNYFAEQHGIDLPLHRAILPSNDAHLTRLASQLLGTKYRTIGMIGLVFKPNTDDLRESPAMRLLEKLLAAGKEIFVHEPEINPDLLIGTNLQYLKKVLPDFAESLVDWDTLCACSEMLLVTRLGVVSEKEIDQVKLPVINLAHFGSSRVRID